MDGDTQVILSLALVFGGALLGALFELVGKGLERHGERVAEGLRACERDPEIWPRMTALARTPWSLRLPWFALAARRLARLGFVEVGSELSKTPTLSIRSRRFYSEQHRTYATMWSFLGSPKISFLTAFEDGSLVHTGSLARDERRLDELFDQGVSGSADEKLAKHLDAVERWSQERGTPRRGGTRGYRGAPRDPSVGTLDEAIAIGRRYYVVRFEPGNPGIADEAQRADAHRARRADAA